MQSRQLQLVRRLVREMTHDLPRFSDYPSPMRKRSEMEDMLISLHLQLMHASANAAQWPLGAARDREKAKISRLEREIADLEAQLETMQQGPGAG